MNASHQPDSVAAWRPWAVAFGLWLALALLAAVTLWHLRGQTLETQKRELGLLSLALTDDIDRGLRGAEEGLNALRTELREGRLTLTGIDATRALRARSDLMPLVRTLWLTDREGRVLTSSDETPAPSVTSFSPPLDSISAETTAISRSFATGGTVDAVVVMAVRFAAAPGTSGGWIYAAIPTKTLLGAFTAALPVTDARMAVFRDDGVRLAVANIVSPPEVESVMAQRLAARPGMELRRFRDGTDHLVGMNSVPRFGIKVVVSRDLSTVLMSWQSAAELAAIALALLLLIAAAAVYLVQRADKRHAQAHRALQAQLTRASKLEALGTLAGGVAHDFNNVLAGIVGFGEMAQDAAVPGSAQARHLQRALGAALRGKALVERILSFSRGGAHRSMVFELEPVVEEVLTLLSASLRPGVILERELEARGARLRGDQTQVFEAVMNLCTNALQAMPDGGMLGVALARVGISEPQVLSHSQLAPGAYLALSVSDQGSGITPDVMEHLFEPFFTTRGAESGTGLGLAVVHGVVAEIGGAIDVQSTPGRGARFTLFFPECSEALDAQHTEARAVPAGTGQRLLVVDDEPELVAMLEEILKGLGYIPMGFTDSTAALEILRADWQRFDAVLTDEVMPGLGGTQLTEAVRSFAPDLPVLLISGYGGALLAQRAAQAGVTRILAKPVQRAVLARALADLLH